MSVKKGTLAFEIGVERGVCDYCDGRGDVAKYDVDPRMYSLCRDCLVEVLTRQVEDWIDRALQMHPITEDNKSKKGNELNLRGAARMRVGRPPKEIAKDVVDSCAGSRHQERYRYDYYLIDYAPLVVVMHRVAAKICKWGGSFDNPKDRKVWCEAMTMIQDDDYSLFEHNRFIPCRFCDQKFIPVVDEVLLKLFLAWYENFGYGKHLLAIHRCPDCGGELTATDIGKYEGDYHTPKPNTVKDDQDWGMMLLQHHTF